MVLGRQGTDLRVGCHPARAHKVKHRSRKFEQPKRAACLQSGERAESSQREGEQPKRASKFYPAGEIIWGVAPGAAAPAWVDWAKKGKFYPHKRRPTPIQRLQYLLLAIPFVAIPFVAIPFAVYPLPALRSPHHNGTPTTPIHRSLTPIPRHHHK